MTVKPGAPNKSVVGERFGRVTEMDGDILLIYWINYVVPRFFHLNPGYLQFVKPA